MNTGYDINQLIQEAQTRWLKASEVLFILQNHEKYEIKQETPQHPPSGSLFLFNRRVHRFFRKDGYSWRKKRDGRTVGEAHERLKVGNAEALNCYYAHGEDIPSFQRRCYWMLDPAYEHIVLVHYRDISDGRFSSGSTSEYSPTPSSTISQSANTHAAQNPGSASSSGYHESYQNHCSPGSIEVNSDAAMRKGIDSFPGSKGNGSLPPSSEVDVNQALRRLEMQLSLDDENVKEYVPFDEQVVNEGGSNEPQHHTFDKSQKIENGRSISWNDVLDFSHGSLPAESNGEEVYILSANASSLRNEVPFSGMTTVQSNTQTQGFGAYVGQTCASSFTDSSYEAFDIVNGGAKDLSIPVHASSMYTVNTNTPFVSTMLFDPSLAVPFEAESSLTVAEEQRFSILDISPAWGFSNDSTKVIVVGSFLCEPSECAWYCMFGDVEVPLHVIQNGVLSCHSPPRSSGKVTLCITSGNRVSCSEIREFEYRDKINTCARCDKHDGERGRSTEELLLLVRFVQMLLSDSSIQQGDNNRLGVDQSSKQENDDDSWSQIIDALLFGGGTLPSTLDWLLQQLLKDKLQQWLSSRSAGEDFKECYLSKKEQGIIHMVAGLGYEWALKPVLGCGVGVNFRDINGWTALHWAARFGREKMVAGLIASGASAVAVTDPRSQDPIGRTAAHIASTNGHKGLAGYLSELALTSHLSSLTLEESELSKGSAAVEAELTVNHISKENLNSNEDQVTLKQSLAAVRNAAQAAARIQSAFRAHSFRKRQEKEVATSASLSDADEYGLTLTDIQGLSAVSKLAFRNMYEHNKAALSIQKNYRCWKGRRDFLTLRQKVVKIQAHVRGYQARKKYICWAVGILDKAVLRWRRRGAGLRGFKPEVEPIDDDKDDDDVVKVFRKEKVNVAIGEAVSRVLSMVKSPEARQQYHRMLGKYQEAKAELQGEASQGAGASQGVAVDQDQDEIFQYL